MARGARSAEGITVKIEGMRELQAHLREMDRNLPKQIRLTLNGVATLVAETAASRVPRRTGRAAASIRPASQQRYAIVAGGGARAPYLPWLDFGGRVGRNHAVKRPFLRTGRYIFASVRDRRAMIREEVAKGLERLARESGFKVS